ncbi:MAG: hypothetical protein Q8P20_08045 [bacterium]|nr:hypothetical protein [bacterium]MDZ4227892.1 hypothetical protein [Candidatus Levybacteria bacterium]
MKPKQEIKIKESQEIKGNMAYMVTWISLGNFLSIKYFDTEKEMIDHYNHLKRLGRQNIAIYRLMEVEK